MKTFKNYYVIQHPSGTIIPESINCQKNLCIKSWFDGSITWDEAKKLGWKCLKVNLTFEIL